MFLGYHGGQCCAIKVIRDFYYLPDQMVYEINAQAGLTNKDANGNAVSSSESFYHLSAPKETALERFKRFLRYCDERRPDGLIEIVLAEGNNGQVQTWEPIILEHGFVKVSSTGNSNSGNTCHVYHRISALGGCDMYDEEEDEYSCECCS